MKIMQIILLSLGILNSSSILIFANENQKEDLMKIIKEFKPPNSLLVSPENPFSTQPIQLYDFNQDRQKEIIVTFQMKANLLKKASNSIHKGLSLAKQLSMPDVVQNFNELTGRLEEKKRKNTFPTKNSKYPV